MEKVRGDDLDKFPIELARLRSVFYPLSIAAASIAGYGWAVQAKTVCSECNVTALNAKIYKHIAVPLTIQVISGSTLQCCFTVDLLSMSLAHVFKCLTLASDPQHAID